MDKFFMGALILLFLTLVVGAFGVGRLLLFSLSLVAQFIWWMLAVGGFGSSASEFNLALGYGLMMMIPIGAATFVAIRIGGFIFTRLTRDQTGSRR